MLAPAELAAVAESFGVSDAQVRRDHLISHLLGVLLAPVGPTCCSSVAPPWPGLTGQLAAQTRLSVSPTEASAAIRAAWARLEGGA
jgi:hypothetical protein